MDSIKSRPGYIVFMLVVAASMMVVSSHTPKTIVVGGSQGWHFGFNYSDWACQNDPFFLNDTLVFKYDLPNGTRMHNVFLLKDWGSYQTCNLTGATMVGNVTAGAGEGLKFVIQKKKHHHFACGVGNGFHCDVGKMKFTFFPYIY